MPHAFEQLFRSFPDTLTVAETASILGGTAEEVVSFLLGQALAGVMVGETWVILKSALRTFVLAGATHPFNRAESPATRAGCDCWPALCFDLSPSSSLAYELS